MAYHMHSSGYSFCTYHIFLYSETMSNENNSNESLLTLNSDCQKSSITTNSSSNNMLRKDDHYIVTHCNMTKTITHIIASHKEAPTAQKADELRRLTKRFRGLSHVQQSKEYEMIITYNLTHLLPSAPDPTAALWRHPNLQSKRSWEHEMQIYRETIVRIAATFHF